MYNFFVADILIVAAYIILQVWVIIFVAMSLEYKRQRSLPHYVSHIKLPINYLSKRPTYFAYTREVPASSAQAMFSDIDDLTHERRRLLRQQHNSHDTSRVTIQIDPDYRVTREMRQLADQVAS